MYKISYLYPEVKYFYANPTNYILIHNLQAIKVQHQLMTHKQNGSSMPYFNFILSITFNIMSIFLFNSFCILIHYVMLKSFMSVAIS